MESYFGIHNHTMFSNIRLLDCINEPKALIKKAIELGLNGIAITDHECLSAHMTAFQYAQSIKEQYPNFKVALGNEIYLTDDRSSGQKYYHFILIAKDSIGYKMLHELSSIAWYNLYVDRRMERVPLLKKELKAEVEKYGKGHLIGTTACMGGELSTLAYEMAQCQMVNDLTNAQLRQDDITQFINYCLDVFGEDFYIECAPSNQADQVLVNSKLRNIAQYFNIPMVVGTDAHYLTAAERSIHKAYLNSKDGDREVDSFYEFAHLMDYNECFELLNLAFNDKAFTKKVIKNTNLIKDKIEDFSLERKQIIPKVELKEYPQNIGSYWGSNNSYRDELDGNWAVLKELLLSDNNQERAWIRDCLDGMVEKGLFIDEYLDRLATEADVIKYIGNKLDDCLFAYFNTFKHYIDLFWECGSIVGPGRGSATGFLSNYLLGITQLDPIRWDLPYWRFLNKERVELPDIDIDLAPSVRPAIFEAIRKERGEFGLIQVATFGTESTKSAIQTACRGYRSEEYPDGIDVDEAQYMSSLIPQERGFLWPIKDVVYGNEEKDRTPVQSFIREVNQYPGLLDIILYIEGLVNKRSSHASGVILYGEDPFETASFMRTPSGDLITSLDLHQAEAAGDTKYDFLVTEVSDKIIQCIKLLQADGEMEDGSLREIYNKYLHPEVMDTTKPEIWEHLEAGDILDVFQFNEGSGLAIAKKCKPKNVLEMTAANAMMRLMSEKGVESQQDRYVRIQQEGLDVFDKEMRDRGISDRTRTALHKYCDTYYGCVPIQEQMMQILMDPDIAHFTLGEANAARKIVAKKKMDQIPKLHQQVREHIDNEIKADYIWDLAIKPSLGYAFSKNHSLPYSFVGVQTLYLATNWNPIYWNCACLIVNSGSLEDQSEEEIVDIFEDEAADLKNGITFEDLPDRKSKIRRTASTDYGKIAKAMGDIINAGIQISLVDINKSDFGFKPDVENNQIMFGMKALLNVSDDTVRTIIANRPYASPKDFLIKAKPGKQAMISLIKSGAFDKMMDRKLCMGWYIWETCDKKQRITLQNMGGLTKYNLLPTENESQEQAARVYEFTRYLKACCLTKNKKYYLLDDRCLEFLHEFNYEDLIQQDEALEQLVMVPAVWDKEYQKWMDIFRAWIATNKDEILQKLNEAIFLEDWNKYASGSLSSWEMEVLCFYYHDHELKNVNFNRYGLVQFSQLPEEPMVDKVITKGDKEIKLFKLNKICGTCIAKNKNKSIVTILSTDGVVNVKFRKEYFALFDKQISQRGLDGVKHVVEKSWFNRGSMIIVQGIRSGDDFIPKKYNSQPGHQLYKILEVRDNNELVLQTERNQGESEDET